MSVSVSSNVVYSSSGTKIGDGTPQSPPPGADWSFKYTGLPINTPLTLNVIATAADNTVGTAQFNFSCSSP